MRQEMPKLFFVVAFLAGDFPADAMRQEPCQAKHAGRLSWASIALTLQTKEML